MSAAKKEDLLLGAIIEDRFIITEKLGQGGMSTVYIGKHKQIDLKVAIKVLHSTLKSDENPQALQESIERFRREAGIINRLNHENVIHTLSFGILGSIIKLDGEGKPYEETKLEEPKPYLILELLEGKALDTILKEQTRLTLRTASLIIEATARALAAAHDIDVVHRDIKPGNVMIVSKKDQADVFSYGGQSATGVKVLDFGISKMLQNPDEESRQQSLTATGVVFGSPLYMSPEQCMGQDLDHRTDIYSLGCMFYELLTGRPPFSGKNPLHTFAMHIYEKPKSPNLYLKKEEQIPPEAETLILKCMEKDPEERYQTIGELMSALAPFV